jgi:hypothetical protein
MDKYVRAMSGPDRGRKLWTRSSGPLARLDWLEGGKLTEQVPDWFIQFFLESRDLGAIDFDSSSLGMSSLEENWTLYRLVGEAAPTSSLEIGIMRGATCLTISRSIEDRHLNCHQTALDIDPHAVEVTSQKLQAAAKAHTFSVLTSDSREWLPSQAGGWQFAFLDGDHSYRTISFELVETFNKMPVGGWIAMHDTGSGLWGWLQDPGVLMFQALDTVLGDQAELTWLDCTDRAQDTQLLYRLGLAPKVAQMANSMFEGWGGLGIVRKVDSSRKISHEDAARFAPLMPPQLPASLARRIARKVKRMTIG